MDKNIFENLIVLELANNHWGNVARGKNIINEFAKIIKDNNVKCAIKLQIRDVDNFIHKDFKDREDLRYIKKTIDTKLSFEDYKILIEEIKEHGYITMATPFDEVSVDTCEQLGVELLKIASSDLNDWVLINKIAETKKPVIVSTGGSSLEDIDNVVQFFENLNIPLAINHCVAIYPSEKNELEVNQIDFLKNRYPNHVIGFSTHEHNDNIEDAIIVAYAKGARTFERHVDIDCDEHKVSPYCSSPSDFDRWVKALKRAEIVCGGLGKTKRIPPQKEIKYLDALVRGAYAKKDLAEGDIITEDNIYYAIPLQKGQLSCREDIFGRTVKYPVVADNPIRLIDAYNIYDTNEANKICKRGL